MKKQTLKCRNPFIFLGHFNLSGWIDGHKDYIHVAIPSFS